MKLYNFPWGPYPRRLTIYLREKAATADVELVQVEFPHRPELWPEGFLRSLNPAHSLPALDTGRGIVIGQSIPILEYLEERLPGRNLLGETPEQRARTREMTAIFDEATAFIGVWARHGSRVNAPRHPASAEAAAVGAERFGAKLRVAESMIEGSFIAGDSVTVSDCVAMALIEFADQFYGVPLPRDCPKLSRWYSEFSSRPSSNAPAYPEDLKVAAYGLPAQTNCSIE